MFPSDYIIKTTILLFQIVANNKLQELLADVSGIVPKVLLESGTAKTSQNVSGFSLSDRTLIRNLKLKQIASRLADKETGILREDIRLRGVAQRSVFSGKDVVSWFLRNLPDVVSRWVDSAIK